MRCWLIYEFTSYYRKTSAGEQNCKELTGFCWWKSFPPLPGGNWQRAWGLEGGSVPGWLRSGLFSQGRGDEVVVMNATSPAFNTLHFVPIVGHLSAWPEEARGRNRETGDHNSNRCFTFKRLFSYCLGRGTRKLSGALKPSLLWHWATASFTALKFSFFIYTINILMWTPYLWE